LRPVVERAAGGVERARRVYGILPARHGQVHPEKIVVKLPELRESNLESGDKVFRVHVVVRTEDVRVTVEPQGCSHPVLQTPPLIPLLIEEGTKGWSGSAACGSLSGCSPRRTPRPRQRIRAA